ncbi:MAG: DnaD domain protein [Anaerovoracaceae bacterium]
MKLVTQKGNPFLEKTNIENIFITEYMPTAPDSYLKVYLFSLMHAKQGLEINEEEIAKLLSLSAEIVEKAFQHWHRLGIISRVGNEIEFISLRDKLFSPKGKEENNEESKEETESSQQKSRGLEINHELKQALESIERILCRPVHPNEVLEIEEWLSLYRASAEAIVYAYAYCNNKGKNNVKYVATVVKDWASRNLRTIPEIDSYLANNDQRHYSYKRIFQALGFRRNPTEEEQRIMDKWLDEMNCGLDQVLTACKTTASASSPSISYVNKVLENWSKDKSTPNSSVKGSANLIEQYYRKLRQEAEDEARRKTVEIYSKIPEIQDIDKDIQEKGIAISTTMITGGENKQAKLEKIRAELSELRSKRVRKLTEKNIPIDYMNVKYKCGICKDTGMDKEGNTCRCYITRREELENGKEK